MNAESRKIINIMRMRPRVCGVCGCPCTGEWAAEYDGDEHMFDRVVFICDECAETVRRDQGGES